MAKDLITLQEYKTYQGITSPSQDTAISNLIPKISQLCKSYCRRTFVDNVDEEKIEYFKDGDYFLLSEAPILGVSAVEYSIDYGKTFTPYEEFVDYVIDYQDSVVRPVQSSSFAPLLNGYRVTYTAGYEVIPADLKLAIMDLLTYYLKQDMAVKSQRDAGSNTVQIEYITKNTLPSHIARVFDLYVASVY